MALKHAKLGNKDGRGGSLTHKLQETSLSLQPQKDDSKDLREFVMEALARYDEIRNQDFEKFRQEIRDLVQQKYDNLKQYILTALTSLSEIIIQESKKEEVINLEVESKMNEVDYKISDLDNKIQRMEKELAKMQEISLEAELKVKEAEHKICNVDNITQKIQDGFIMTQFRLMEYAVRIRGIKEDSRENLRKTTAEVFAAMLKVSSEEIMCKIDKVYRVNSLVAKQRQLPRDVVIYFSDKSIRKNIVQKSFNSTLEVNGSKIWIYKELPSKILKDRKDFGFLVTELKKQNILFRWNAPTGLTLWYQGERFRLNTVEKAEEFYKIFKMGPVSSCRLSLSGIQEGEKEKQNEQEIEAQRKEMGTETLEKQQAIQGSLEELPLDSSLDATAGIQQQGQRSQPPQVKKRRQRFYKTKRY